MLYLISGDADGAGKTTLANKLSRNVLSLAGLLRFEMHKLYPQIDWWNRSQAFKDGTKINGKTPRELMIAQATAMREKDVNHYVRALCEEIKRRQSSVTGYDTIAIDDMRFGNEILYFRSKFDNAEICHFHICMETTNLNLETELLKSVAMYRVSR